MTAAAAVVKHACRGLEVAPVRAIEIGEAGHRGVELQFDRPCGTMTLLTNNNFSLAIYALAFRQPFRKFLAVSLGRFAHLMIVFLPEHKEDDVSILFNRS